MREDPPLVRLYTFWRVQGQPYLHVVVHKIPEAILNTPRGYDAPKSVTKFVFTQHIWLHRSKVLF
jgi:hypothetical protein